MEDILTAASSCMAADCSYTDTGSETVCSPGGNDCSLAFFRESPFLAAADPPIHVTTRKINALLRQLSQNPPAGYQLAILWTPAGALLRWVRHVGVAPTSGVAFASGVEANEKAFKLIPVEEMTFDEITDNGPAAA